jgi:hypothetical protein
MAPRNRKKPEKAHWHQIFVAHVLNYAPKCTVCEEEVIDGSHMLVPVIHDNNLDKAYTTLCYFCAYDFIVEAIQGEAGCECEECKDFDKEEDDEG